jgi:hypothetical protein
MTEPNLSGDAAHCRSRRAPSANHTAASCGDEHGFSSVHSVCLLRIYRSGIA